MKKRRVKDKICSKCFRPGYRFRGERWLCVIHHRFDCIKTSAKSSGKTVPTNEQLKELANELIQNNMKCEPCGAKMQWVKESGGLNTVSLQHDRSGRFRFICLKCNSRHDDLPGDTFYDLPKGHWRCPHCKEIKPLTDFYTNSADKIHGGCCKSCRKILNKKMWSIYGKKWAANSKRKREAKR